MGGGGGTAQSQCSRVEREMEGESGILHTCGVFRSWGRSAHDVQEVVVMMRGLGNYILYTIYYPIAPGTSTDDLP